MKSTLLLLSSFGLSLIGLSQNIIRGPYMQSPTHQSIKLMWRTDVNSSSKVWYGVDSTNLNQEVNIGNNVKDHIVELTGLSASTTYYYAVGTTSSILSTVNGMHRFKTHPLPGTDVPVRVWAIGDFGRNSTGQVDVKQSYFEYTGDRETDVWLWLGDNAYNDGKDSEYQSKVFTVTNFSDAFSHMPFWPSPGNHDYNEVWAESTLFGIPYANIPFSQHEGPYFDMVEVPKYGEAGGFSSQHEVFYSFDYGDVHFLSLNSEVYDYTQTFTGINQMKAWIESDLQQNTAKFTVAYFHQPPYSKGSHDSDDIQELVMKAMREKILPTLENYDIDLVVCGHSHVFERSALIKGHYGNSSSLDASTMLLNNSNGNFAQGNAYLKDGLNSTPEGTVYVVCGNSGSSENAPSLNHPVMKYTHGGSGAMGSFIIDVKKNRLDGRYLKSDGTIGDQFTILKKDMVIDPIQTLVVCENESFTLNSNLIGGSDSLAHVWGNNGSTGATQTLQLTAATSIDLSITDLMTGQVVTTTFNIHVSSLSTPTITFNAATSSLVCNINASSNSYQWFLNGTAISGANSPTYTPTVNGNYTVKVKDEHDCSMESSVFNHTILGIEDLTSDELYIFPNPATDAIHLFSPESLKNEKFVLYDAFGRAIKTIQISEMNMLIPVDGLESGNYFLIHADKQVSLPFIKH